MHIELLKSFFIFTSEDKFSLFRIIQDNRVLADFDSPLTVDVKRNSKTLQYVQFTVLLILGSP